MNSIVSKNAGGTRYEILSTLLSLHGFDSIESFQNHAGLLSDGLYGMKTHEKLYSHILDVDHVEFAGHYYMQEFPKKQIVLHHSAGRDNSRSMFDYWKNDGVYHVATSIGINDDGKVVKGYDERHWGHHIGMQNIYNLARNRESVAVEICNWGALNDDMVSWAGVRVPEDKVIELNYKNIKYFEKYTQKEIDSLELWIVINAIRFDIPLDYNENDMWKVSQNAIAGTPGIYTHNSYISWKSDISPQPNMINMLSGLKDKYLS